MNTRRPELVEEEQRQREEAAALAKARSARDWGVLLGAIKRHPALVIRAARFCLSRRNQHTPVEKLVVLERVYRAIEKVHGGSVMGKTVEIDWARVAKALREMA